MITDRSGNTIIAGRNEAFEGHFPNKRTAHAEMYCVRNLDIEKYSDLSEYHLYTTMEPCPMCMGTIVMGGIRKLHVDAKDKYCGAMPPGLSDRAALLRHTYVNAQKIFFGAFSPDFSPVGSNDAVGNGKPQSIAAGGRTAGSI